MATTRVYNSYAEFQGRDDRSGNGISLGMFMARYGGDMEAALAANEANEGCWDCWGCTGCTDC